MHSLNKSKIELNIARLLAALFVFFIIGHFVLPVGEYFGFHLDPRLAYVAGGLAALGTWFASRKVVQVLQQTEDAMKVPTAPAYLHNGGRKGSNKPAGETCVTGKCGGVVSGGVCTSTDECSEKKGDGCSPCYAKLEQEQQADGAIRVTVTAFGLSKREFNNLRARLEAVSATAWQHPVNLGNGKRVMNGTVRACSEQKQAIAKLEELTGKRV